MTAGYECCLPRAFLTFHHTGLLIIRIPVSFYKNSTFKACGVYRRLQCRCILLFILFSLERRDEKYMRQTRPMFMVD